MSEVPENQSDAKVLPTEKSILKGTAHKDVFFCWFHPTSLAIFWACCAHWRIPKHKNVVLTTLESEFSFPYGAAYCFSPRQVTLLNFPLHLLLFPFIFIAQLLFCQLKYSYETHTISFSWLSIEMRSNVRKLIHESSFYLFSVPFNIGNYDFFPSKPVCQHAFYLAFLLSTDCLHMMSCSI